MTEQENRILFALIEPEREYEYFCDEYPDFTIPEWRIRLQEWLTEETNLKFYLAFIEWQWCKYDIIQGSKDRMWVMHIILNLQQEILEYLHTDEAKERFGWVQCAECGGQGYYGYGSDYADPNRGDVWCCTTCEGIGKIKSEWLVELEK